MEHIRVGDDESALVSDALALVRSRVAVVHANLRGVSLAAVRGGAVQHDPQRPDLILRQRLGGEEVKGRRVGVVQQRVEHRGVVAHRLTARRAGGDAHVGTPERRGDSLVLMREEPESVRVVGVERDARRGECGDRRGSKMRGIGTLRRERGYSRGYVQPVFALSLTAERIRPGGEVRYERVDGHGFQPVAPARPSPFLFGSPASFPLGDRLLPDERFSHPLGLPFTLRSRDEY